MQSKKVKQPQILNKMLWRMIGESRGRFIAITLIIMLGVMIFVGVKGIGPGYRDSAEQTLTSARLHDIEVTSTGGLTKTDLHRLQKVSGVTVSPSKSTFALARSDESVVQVYGYRNNTGLDRLIMRSGRLPRNKNEIVLDARAKEYGKYKLGGRFQLKKSDGLQRRSYKIVGFADSPRYINNNYDRGNANIGSGTVAYFAYVPQTNLTAAAYSSIALRLNTRPAGDSYTSTYKQAVSRKMRAVKHALRGRSKARGTELVATASKPLNRQAAKLDAAQKQLAAAKAQLSAASGGAITTNAQISAQEQKLAAGRKQIATAKAKLNQLAKVTYSYDRRGDLVGFSDYGDSADRIAAIGDVFPVFFFLIAALITFTTVSRMISEDRVQLGTMKALGFSRWAIARNYFLYALLAAVIGTVFGAVIGIEGLTRFVLVISQANIFTGQVLIPQWGDIAIATALALAATIGAVLIVAPSELRVKPAELMLPKAPKNGKKILLERMQGFWRHLSFNQKVSLRNLFRFKSRMFLTIIGIAGGAGLILTGFGIRDSILGTTNAQFGNNGVARYQAVVRLSGDDALSKARGVLTADKHYQQSTPVVYDVGKISRKGKTVNNVSVVAPQSSQNFAKYVHLQARGSSEVLKLPQKGLILSMKAADVLGIHWGDKVTVTSAAGVKRQVRVVGVVTNYTGHYAYMSKAAYDKAWGRTQANSLLVKTSSMGKTAQRSLARRLLKDGGAVNTTYTSSSVDMVGEMGRSMNAVVLILIVLSGMLSFVVLYNLTNINVSERMRELSTIKVLGFYDGEVTMYIVRENILLTLVGILCSFGVGRVLTQYILNQAASESIVFPFIIHWPGYVAAAVLTLGFTAIVMLVTHRRLKNVDMLEALAARE
jgi:putative ABC transport system permease protein